MNILVLATAASEGGALTVLNNLYDEVSNSDTLHHWFFAVSVEGLKSNDTITILDYSSAKKSRLHRLKFDKMDTKKIVKNHKIDCVLSLQNTLVSGISIPQILYLQQSLPFVNKRYTFFENKTFWLYQNVIYKFIKKAVKIADKVIVQSAWVKDAVHESIGKSKDDIIVCHPRLNEKLLIENDGSYTSSFFYPAGPFSYKNHQMIVDALRLLNRADLEMSFTLDLESDYVKSLKDYEELSSLHMIGSIPYSEVCERYSKSVLVFASEIETFGLPLLEARLSNAIILALESPFAFEILKDYTNVYYFKDAHDLAVLMDKVLDREIVNKKQKDNEYQKTKSLFDEVEDFLRTDI